ncbi:MAG: hypothetical protein K2W82_13100 [Candidatus Obscuribacterales bacterium]|nr:hypothetical protein [Candidatus Obscuribacterales bacterium]
MAGDKTNTDIALETMGAINTIGEQLNFNSLVPTTELSELFSKVGDYWQSNDQKLLVKQLEFSNIYKECTGNEQQKLERSTVSLEALKRLVDTPLPTVIEKRDSDGKLISSVSQDKEETRVQHKTETAIRKDGQTILQGPDYSVVVDKDGRRLIDLKEDRYLVREPDGGATIIDKRNNHTYTISPQQIELTLKEQQKVVFATPKVDLDATTASIREKLQPGQIGLLVIQGSGNRLIFESGTVIDIQGQAATIKTKSGETCLLKTKEGKLFTIKDGKEVELTKENCPSAIKIEKGKFYIDGIEVDPATFQLNKHNLNVDLAANRHTITSPDGNKTTTETKPDGTCCVKTDKQTISNNPNDNKVCIQHPDGTITCDLEEQSVETKEIVDKPQETVIKETQTIIRPDGTVKFHDGPELHPDGSVQFDQDTYIDKNMNSNVAVATESKAANLAADSISKADIVASKALNKTVTWSDIASLSSCLSCLLSLLSSLPPGSFAHAQLQAGLSRVQTALELAKAKINDRPLSSVF